MVKISDNKDKIKNVFLLKVCQVSISMICFTCSTYNLDILL